MQFLSMKLEAVNSRIGPGIEVFPPKDVSICIWNRFSIHFVIWFNISTIHFPKPEVKLTQTLSISTFYPG